LDWHSGRASKQKYCTAGWEAHTGRRGQHESALSDSIGHTRQQHAYGRCDWSAISQGRV